MVSKALQCTGLLAGVAAKGQRREHMQLLADCQRVYCDARLMLVADVVAARMAEYCREPLPSLTRSGCSYLMQVCVAPSCAYMWRHFSFSTEGLVPRNAAGCGRHTLDAHALGQICLSRTVPLGCVVSPLAWLRLLHSNQSITPVNSNFRSWTGTNVSTLGWLDEGPGTVTQVCQMEHQLYDQFFPESDGDGTALAPLMDPLCTVLYDALRPVFIQLSSLESLCSLVDILQHEVRTKVVPTPLPSMTRKLLHRHAAHRHCMCMLRGKGVCSYSPKLAPASATIVKPCTLCSACSWLLSSHTS